MYVRSYIHVHIHIFSAFTITYQVHTMYVCTHSIPTCTCMSHMYVAIYTCACTYTCTYMYLQCLHHHIPGTRCVYTHSMRIYVCSYTYVHIFSAFTITYQVHYVYVDTHTFTNTHHCVCTCHVVLRIDLHTCIRLNVYSVCIVMLSSLAVPHHRLPFRTTFHHSGWQTMSLKCTFL